MTEKMLPKNYDRKKDFLLQLLWVYIILLKNKKRSSERQEQTITGDICVEVGLKKLQRKETKVKETSLMGVPGRKHLNTILNTTTTIGKPQ